MAYNPYGAPGAQGPEWAAHVAPPGEPQWWDPGEVMGHAWGAVKVHWVPLVFGTLIGTGAGALPQQLSSVYRTVVLHGEFEWTDPLFVALFGGGALVSWVIQAFFLSGFTRMYLSAARGNVPELSDVFSGGPRFFAMLGAMMLHAIIVSIGFALLFVPGVILTLGLGLYPYFVVERNMGAVEALRASWDLTMGHKGNLLLLLVYSIGVGLLGTLACCVGILPAIAVIGVANAIVFTRLTGTVGQPPFSPPGQGAPPPGYPPPYGGFGPPPGGYGPPPGGYGAPPGPYGSR